MGNRASLVLMSPHNSFIIVFTSFAARLPEAYYQLLALSISGCLEDSEASNEGIKRS
jgi:hypothetical protein